MNSSSEQLRIVGGVATESTRGDDFARPFPKPPFRLATDRKFRVHPPVVIEPETAGQFPIDNLPDKLDTGIIVIIFTNGRDPTHYIRPDSGDIEGFRT